MQQVKAWESFLFLKRAAVREGAVVSAARQKVSWNGAINPGRIQRTAVCQTNQFSAANPQPVTDAVALREVKNQGRGCYAGMFA
jgi:hypothetical protein